MTTPPPQYGAYPPPPGPYAGYYGYPQYPQPQPTNSLAIVSLVCAFLFAPLGIVFGHISLSQIKKTGEEGHGLAVAGLVISYLITVLTILVVVLSVVFIGKVANELESLDGLTPEYPDITATPSPPTDNNLPPFNPPKTLGSNCQYPATTEPASKPVEPPQAGRIATDPALIRASIITSQGVVGLALDNGKTPCTVNNFTSLAKQGFFDNTTCHRLTTSTELGVLQCGDPGRRPDRHRHGRAGLPVPERVPDQPVPADRSRIENPGALSAGHAGDGQRGPWHQWQSVLPGVQGFSAAADLHGVRHDRWPRPDGRRYGRRSRCRRQRRRRQAGDGRDDQVSTDRLGGRADAKVCDTP
jgi:hypothetical protein